MGTAKDKVRQVFQFLSEFQKLRIPPARELNPEWVQYLADLPKDPCISIGFRNRRTTGQDDVAADTDSIILRVRRPNETACPTIPNILRDWVRHGLQDLDADPWHVATRNRESSDGVVTEHFDDDSARVAAWNAWTERRRAWAVAERPVRAVMRVFQKLFGLRGRLEREAEKFQLVLGDGFLKAQDTVGTIDHPILLQRVELQFDPNVPEFRIVEADDPCDLYTVLLGMVPSADSANLNQCRSELTSGAYHPLDGAATDGFLTRVIQSVFADGRLVSRNAPDINNGAPVVYRNPVIYLAPRAAGFATAIDGVLKRLQESDHGEDISPVLSRLVGVDPAEGSPVDLNATGESFHQAPAPNVGVDLLLTKPANPEQERVIRRLASTGSVLVQGPPGTGKTHTIANLVGHLLAQGKRILVTSETAKALRVVRESIVEELRPLCVSLLDTDINGRKELEESVAGIVARLSSSDTEQLDEQAAALQAERQALKIRIDELNHSLARAVKDEYDSVVVGGQGVLPSDAARAVVDGAGQHDWIPGPLRRSEGLPLSPDEISELYRLGDLLPAEDESELAGPLPSLDDLPSPSTFTEIAERLRSLRTADLRVDDGIWPADDFASGDEMRATCRHLPSVLAVFDRQQPWFRECVEAGCSGGAQRELWDELIEIIEQTYDNVARWQTHLVRNDIEIAVDNPPEEHRRACSEIVQHLNSGGRLDFWSLLCNRGWKRLRAIATVNGRAPESAADFEAIDAWFSVRDARKKLHRRWEKQLGHLCVPAGEELGNSPEQHCHEFVRQFREALAWHESVWRPCLEALQRIGVRWEQVQVRIPPTAGQHPESRRIEKAVRDYVLPTAQCYVRRRELDEMSRAQTSVVERLAIVRSHETSGRVVRCLHDAALALDSEAFSRAWNRLDELHRLRRHFTRRNQLLDKLESVAPEWANCIRHRMPPHDGATVPGDSAQGWLFRQFQEELDRRSAVDVHKLQSDLAQINERLRLATRKYVDCRTWAAQCRRTRLAQQQALQGWLGLIRRPGFKSGVRSAVLKAEARRKLDQCRDAVPVWIMPLSRVAESFDCQATQFDVVIIDEASQSNVTGLLALALGREVVVVGDNEQVSPSAVGLDLQRIDGLINQYLEGIPNYKLYDGRTSVYDLASQSFGETIRLVEHFRSVPEIIQFSNDLCYHGQIKPLRESSSVSTRPFVVSHRVADGRSDNKINRPEAAEVASLLIAATEQPEYADKSMGAISMVGEDQALLIDSLLLRHLGEVIYAKRRIVCGTPAQFQGDERDIVFVSLVDWSPTGLPLPKRTETTSDWKQRFNVAASRARDQLWVVHSLSPATDLKPGDLRLRLIQHAEDPAAALRELKLKTQKAESEFERRVIQRLHQRGFRTHSQWEVGAYRIDIVVEGSNCRKVAIECDGDRFHPPEKLKEDMDRQVMLERLGWRFVRIRGSAFFRNPDSTMSRVFHELDHLGVEPIGPALRPAGEQAEVTELSQRIVRRAEELRRSWQEPDKSDGQRRKPSKARRGRVLESSTLFQ